MNVILRWMGLKDWNSKRQLMRFSSGHSFCQCEEFRVVDVIIFSILDAPNDGHSINRTKKWLNKSIQRSKHQKNIKYRKFRIDQRRTSFVPSAGGMVGR